MSDFNVSTRYANALLAIAIETNQFEAISADVDNVLDLLTKVKELKVAIYSPVIKLEKKIQIIEALFKDKVNLKTFEFLVFILNKNRATLLTSILKKEGFYPLRIPRIISASFSRKYQKTPRL